MLVKTLIKQILDFGGEAASEYRWPGNRLRGKGLGQKGQRGQKLGAEVPATVRGLVQDFGFGYQGPERRYGGPESQPRGEGSMRQARHSYRYQPKSPLWLMLLRESAHFTLTKLVVQ